MQLEHLYFTNVSYHRLVAGKVSPRPDKRRAVPKLPGPVVVLFILLLARRKMVRLKSPPPGAIQEIDEDQMS